MERSPLLSALCLLSFTGNSMACLVYLSAALFNQSATTLIGKWSSVHDTSGLTVPYFLIFALLNALSFAGVYNMWKLHKKGYWIYLASRISILIIPVIWLGTGAFSMVAFLFALLFAVLYANEMRKL